MGNVEALTCHVLAELNYKGAHPPFASFQKETPRRNPSRLARVSSFLATEQLKSAYTPSGLRATRYVLDAYTVPARSHRHAVYTRLRRCRACENLTSRRRRAAHIMKAWEMQAYLSLLPPPPDFKSPAPAHLCPGNSAAQNARATRAAI